MDNPKGFQIVCTLFNEKEQNQNIVVGEHGGKGSISEGEPIIDSTVKKDIGILDNGVIYKIIQNASGVIIEKQGTLKQGKKIKNRVKVNETMAQIHEKIEECEDIDKALELILNKYLENDKSDR